MENNEFMNDSRSLEQLLSQLRIENYSRKVFNIIDHNNFSHSKLSVFNTCQGKYKYSYIDKVPTERKDDAIHFIKGRTIHNLLENRFSNKSGLDNEITKQITEISFNDLLAWNNIVKSFIESDLAKNIESEYMSSRFSVTEERLRYEDKLFTGAIDFYYITDD